MKRLAVLCAVALAGCNRPVTELPPEKPLVRSEATRKAVPVIAATPEAAMVEVLPEVEEWKEPGARRVEAAPRPVLRPTRAPALRRIRRVSAAEPESVPLPRPDTGPSTRDLNIQIPSPYDASFPGAIYGLCAQAKSLSDPAELRQISDAAESLDNQIVTAMRRTGRQPYKLVLALSALRNLIDGVNAQIQARNDPQYGYTADKCFERARQAAFETGQAR